MAGAGYRRRDPGPNQHSPRDHLQRERSRVSAAREYPPETPRADNQHRLFMAANNCRGEVCTPSEDAVYPIVLCRRTL